MGKAKPVKKSSTPLKISTSLFQKKSKSFSAWSGTDDDSNSMSSIPSPSPKKSMKAKSSKAETKPKPSAKKAKGAQSTNQNTSTSSNSTPKQSKSGSKIKLAEKKSIGKGKGSTSFEKVGVKTKTVKGNKGSPAKSTSKTVKKEKEKKKAARVTKASILRKRSKSNSTITSSASSSTNSTTSSSSRTPSPVQTTSRSSSKAKASPARSDLKKAVKKKIASRTGTTSEKNKDKGKGVKSKKSKVTKTINAKHKVIARPVKPKAKLKRMASLNAKAILEASFNFETSEKKQKSPAVTPSKVPVPKIPLSMSTGTSMDNDDGYTGDFKPLTLLFSCSQPEVPIPKSKSVSPGGERKRKSSVVKIPPNNDIVVDRRDSIAASIENSIAKAVSPDFRRNSVNVGVCIGRSTSPFMENKFSPAIGVPVKIRKSEKGKSKSPTPKKKTKVTSSSVSTSTSPFEHHEDEIVAFHSKPSQPIMSKLGLEAGITTLRVDTTGTTTERLNTLHTPFSVQGQTNIQNQIQQTNQHHSSPSSGKLQKSASCQTKEKVNKSSTPVAHFGYQPAGPLIEPHKTVMTGTVPAGLLPDCVRIPSDLKVTYQTNPPTTSVLTLSTSSFTSQSSKGSISSSTSTKYASDHVKSHIGVSTSTATLKPNKQILHQPYKSAVSSTVSLPITTTRPAQQVEVQQTASFSTHTGTFTMPGSSLPSSLPAAATSYLSQQSQIGGGMTIGPSHIPPGALVPAGGGSEAVPAYVSPSAASAAGVYYGYGAGSSHSSPFTPSKYPFVAPDYRPPQHSPYSSSFMYAPGTPQASPSYFMTPFYSPPVTPGTGPGSLAFGGSQATRPLLSAHHPSAAAGAAAAYYQSGPPLAHHPASNYYVAGPSLQPSHHSIQPTTAPGHAGPSPPNRSSQTACPSTSCPPNSNSTSNSNSTTSSSSNINNRLNKPLPPKRQQPSAINASPRLALDLAINRAKTPTATATKTFGNRRKECSTPALGADPPKTVFSKALDIVQSQAKQLESAKTFTEQYCLPDDITITPIIMCPGNTSASAYYGNGLKSPTSTVAEQRKRDIVHVIDPRSGHSTTIAKHISNNNLLLGSSPSNVSPVKPNNAGNVGKISPDLDVIVIARGSSLNAGTMKTTPSALKKNTNRRQTIKQQSSASPISAQSFASAKNITQRMALATSAVVNNNIKGMLSGPLQPSYQVSGQFPTNLVQPLPQQVLEVARSENKTKTSSTTGVKRKGLSLNECIDGLKMKKKMRILGDTNISFRMAPAAPERGTADVIAVSTILPLSAPVNLTVPGSNDGGGPQRVGRKDNKPRQRPRKVNSSPGVRRVSASISRRTASTESDIGSMIINGPDAQLAASALVVLPLKANGSTVQLPMQFSLDSDRRTPLIKKERVEREPFDNRRRKPLKLKICTVGGKVITRSATQNSKVKTRAKSNTNTAAIGHQIPTTEISASKKGVTRNRQVLLRSKKDGNKSDSSAGAARGGIDKSSGTRSKPIFPSYFNTVAAVAASVGNGSSTLTTSNNHVILRIPKSNSQSGNEKVGKTGFTEVMNVESGRYVRLSSDHYQTGIATNSPLVTTCGNMTLNALKKRAIVKPLSSSVVNNGAIHSMPMANKKVLPTYPHPRWSNGWTFEGDSFEAKVYLRNDDQPVLRRCYASMRHDGGDIIRPRDCVLLKSGPRKTDLPFVAKVASLWENPLDGEMMFSLLWYYRPEHTEIGRSKDDMPDEIFASKHRDCNSVATIEDRCYVLTYNEYCRYKKRLKQLQEGIPGYIYPPLVPLSTNSAVSTMAVTNFAVEIAAAVWSGMSAARAEGITTEQSQSQPQFTPSPSPGKVSPEVVFFCRKVYDYRQKRMLKNPS